MSTPRIDRQLRLQFEGGLHHGSGYGHAGLIDRPLLRDSRRLPYLSGAAIKGKFRWAAIRILNSTERGDEICEQKAGGFCRKPDPCQVCRIFGSPWRDGKAVFEDAHPPVEQKAILELVRAGDRTAGASIRAGAGIERVRRVVKKEHLFNTEVAPAMTFKSRIEGDLVAEDWTLLEECALVLTHFGADGSRGLGRCRYELEGSRWFTSLK